MTFRDKVQNKKTRKTSQKKIVNFSSFIETTKCYVSFDLNVQNTVSMIYKHKLTKYKNHKTQGRRGRVNYFFSRYIILLDPEG